MKPWKLDGEVWAPVVGYEDLYEVSDIGRIWSKERDVRETTGSRPGTVTRRAGRMLALADRQGYQSVSLSRNGQLTNFSVHLLVMAAFIGPRPDGFVARHLNGDSRDNRVANLAYGTPSENSHDTVKHGTHRHIRKTHCPKGHPYSGGNLHIRRTGGRGCKACNRESSRRRKNGLKQEALACVAMPVLIFTGITGAGLARADDPMTDTEWAYAQAFGKAAICAALNDYPTEAGVYGVATGISEDGFAPEAVARIVNYSVETWCPQHWPLLQHIGRRARHEMPA